MATSNPSVSEKVVALFEPLTIRGVTLRNRIFMSPMCQYSSEDGFATDWHLVHLGSRAVGGAALITVEATGVTPEGRITPGCLGLYKTSTSPSFRRSPSSSIRAARSGHSTGPRGPQGQHARASRRRRIHSDLRRRLANYRALADSVSSHRWHPARDDHRRDRARSEAQAKAAQRAVKAGFKVIEIHAAHGYLLNEFMSPLSNTRTDSYGGSLENRLRFTIETIKAMRGVIPAEMPLMMKISRSIGPRADSRWRIRCSSPLRPRPPVSI